MNERDPLWHFKIADTDEPKQAGYDEWKRAKILKSIAESQDVERLLTAEEVWKKLGLQD